MILMEKQILRWLSWVLLLKNPNGNGRPPAQPHWSVTGRALIEIVNDTRKISHKFHSILSFS